MSMIQTLTDITADDLINIGTAMINKNLRSTLVQVKVNEDHIAITDRQGVLLTFIKKASPSPSPRP